MRTMSSGIVSATPASGAPLDDGVGVAEAEGTEAETEVDGRGGAVFVVLVVGDEFVGFGSALGGAFFGPEFEKKVV